MNEILNCKNCGAPIDLSKSKCPYCDTPYMKEKHNKKKSNYYYRVDRNGMIQFIPKYGMVLKKQK